jgi:general secretion pathway protein I
MNRLSAICQGGGLKPAPRKTTQQRGFTLLEVLVALGIAATALVSLYTLAGQLLKGSNALEVRQAALWCADNHLVTVALGQFAPPLGETQHACSQLGRAYSVKQNIISTPNPLFRRIELSVYAKEATDTSERLAFLATVIPQDSGR